MLYPLIMIEIVCCLDQKSVLYDRLAFSANLYPH